MSGEEYSGVTYPDGSRTNGSRRAWGGNVFGVDVRLQLEGNRITGRMGGRAIGNSFEVTYNERTRELTGRIGGKVDGKDVNFRLSREGKPLLAALLAGLAVYYMEVEARSRSNSG